MNQIVNEALDSINKAELAFCKFISANDAGKTGAHQEGFYIPKNSYSLAFDTPGVKGENKEHFVKIKWQSDFETTSRFIYYGNGTRNEYRLTRFGKGFPFSFLPAQEYKNITVSPQQAGRSHRCPLFLSLFSPTPPRLFARLFDFI